MTRNVLLQMETQDDVTQRARTSRQRLTAALTKRLQPAVAAVSDNLSSAFISTTPSAPAQTHKL